MKTPLNWRSKSEGRHYKRQQRQIERFLNKLITDIKNRIAPISK